VIREDVTITLDVEFAKLEFPGCGTIFREFVVAG
jgi:hypothetical protein